MAYRKGLVLTWGTINVIVSADGMKDKEESLTTVCCGPAGAEHAPTQVAQKLYCATCADTVPYADLKKAQKVGNAFAIVEQQEVATTRDSVLGASKKMLTVVCRDANEVDAQMLPGQSAYLLTPEGAPQMGAYSLLYDTIARHPEVAFLTQWTPSSKPSPFRLQAFRGGLVIQQLSWPEQVRAVPDLGLIEALPEHQQMIDTLITQQVQPFDPTEFSNAYGAALAALVASKEAVSGVVPDKATSGPKTPPSAGGVDLTAALNAMMAPAPTTRKKASA